MDIPKLLWVVLIFIVVSILWVTLGVKMELTTRSISSAGMDEIKMSHWGGEINQKAPIQNVGEVEVSEIEEEMVRTEEIDIKEEEKEMTKKRVSFISEDISVEIDVDYKKKGLITYNTYQVDFSGKYVLKNRDEEEELRNFTFMLPQDVIMFSNLNFAVDGEEIPDDDITDGLNWTGALQPEEVKEIEVSYSARGLNEWSYMLGKNVKHNDFRMEIVVDGENIDLWEGSLSPTEIEGVEDGRRWIWDFDQVITDKGIGISVEKALNPFAIAKNLSFAGPLSFFLYLIALITMLIIREKELHPMHFAFIASAYFVFNLLLAYLVKYIPVPYAFSISFLVSFALIVSFMWRILGLKFTLFENGIFLVLFLLVFPLSFFTVNRGLILVITGIVALAMLMHLSARFKWSLRKSEK